MDALAAYTHPVVGVSGEVLDTTRIRGTGRQRQEPFNGNNLDIPAEPRQIEASVIFEEGAVV